MPALTERNCMKVVWVYHNFLGKLYLVYEYKRCVKSPPPLHHTDPHRPTRPSTHTPCQRVKHDAQKRVTTHLKPVDFRSLGVVAPVESSRHVLGGFVSTISVDSRDVLALPLDLAKQPVRVARSQHEVRQGVQLEQRGKYPLSKILMTPRRSGHVRYDRVSTWCR